MYGDKTGVAWGDHEAYYIPTNTITSIYYGRWSFPPHIKKAIHEILVDEGRITCIRDHKDDDDFTVYQCLKYTWSYVLNTATDGSFVVHPRDEVHVKAYVEGTTSAPESHTKKHKASK